MSQPANERSRPRATVLVASDSSIFLDIVSDMVVDCGLQAASPARAEPPWLSVTRTQAALVICDCADRSAHLTSLIAEAVARGLPLLVATAALDRDASTQWALATRVARLTFPIDRATFRTLIDELILPTQDMVRHVALSAGGFAIDAGLRTRTLVDVAVGAVRPLSHTPGDHRTATDAPRRERLETPPL